MSDEENIGGLRSMSYAALFEAAGSAFFRGITSLRLNKLQAFAYAYDHMEALLRDTDQAVKIGAYTALFFHAKENVVGFVKDDQYCLDVLDELRDALSLPSIAQRDTLDKFGSEKGLIEKHIDVVRQEYLWQH